MKVVHLPSSYMPETLGGTEIYVDGLADELSRLGTKIVVAFHAATDAEDGSLRRDYAIARLPRLPVPTRRQLYEVSCGEPPGFRRLLQEETPDLLHFHAFTPGAGPDHVGVARSLGIPYVVTYHTPTMSCTRGTLFRWGTDPCDGVISAARCSACVLQSLGVPAPLARLSALSPLRADRLRDSHAVTALAAPDLLRRWHASWTVFMEGARHIVACAEWCENVLASNGVPRAKMSVLRQALPGKPRIVPLRLPVASRSPVRLGYLGRITRVKAPGAVVQATRGLRTRGIDAHCELVGPVASDEKPWLDDLIERGGGSSAYLGIKRGKALVDWLRSLDVLVIPSQSMETGPLVLLEAWEQGTPVVGVDTGGVREFLQEAGLGELLFPPHDVDAIIEAVQRCVTWDPTCKTEVAIRGTTELARSMLRIYERAIRD